MMKKLPFIIVLIVIVTALAVPVVSYAQGTAQGVKIDDSLRPENAPVFPLDTSTTSSRAAVGNIVLQLIAGSLIYAAGPVAVFMIAMGGFRYVISHGDQTQMEGAKKTIMWAIIGLVVIIVSYAIVTNIIRIAETTGQTSTSQTSGSGGGQSAPPSQTAPSGGGGDAQSPVPL
jgi:hypothetical protein